MSDEVAFCAVVDFCYDLRKARFLPNPARMGPFPTPGCRVPAASRSSQLSGVCADGFELQDDKAGRYLPRCDVLQYAVSSPVLSGHTLTVRARKGTDV